MPSTKENEKFILAYDHGTSGVKTALVSIYGKVLDFEFEKISLHLTEEKGGAEQDPDEWWDTILSTSKRLLDKQLVSTDDIVAISCSSQWSGTVPVDADGQHLMNAIIWMDTRGAHYIKKTLKGFPKVSGYPIQDILRFVRKTGGAPGLSGKDPIAHILYIKYEHPEIYKKTYKFLDCIDFLNLKLTGKFNASVSSITLHWVTNTQKINNIYYDQSLIKRLRIDKSKLPDLVEPLNILGNVKPEIADQLGINRDVKVSIGAPDLQAAVIGSGAIQDYQGHIYLGTSSWIICHIPKRRYPDVFHNIATIPSSIPGKYFVVNEQETAGALLTFLRDQLFFYDQEDYINNPRVYQMFDNIVDKVPVGSGNIIFTPWLFGERTPIEDHTVRGTIFNISLKTNKNDIIRAAFEGIAYNSRWVQYYVEKFIKKEMNPLNIIGGGAQSDVWCQIYADVLNRTIRRVRNPIQANVRGAAFIASVGLGYVKFVDIPKFIQIDREFTPIPENVKKYNILYKEFIELYKRNKAAHKRLNSNKVILFSKDDR